MYPTKAQLAFISYIEDRLGLEFTGNTKQEASEWIDKHKGFLKLEENDWAIINGY